MDLDVDACYRAFRTRDARFDGRLFSGVRTTGIYCRPSVRRARRNARTCRSIEPQRRRRPRASGRACDAGRKRRPSSRPGAGRRTRCPGPGADRGGRARRRRVSMASPSVWASATRQLRRLFRQHLGASPVSVAQTRRVLLAKQLIHETRLPMAEVALASGFGSIRRFNEIFQGSSADRRGRCGAPALTDRRPARTVAIDHPSSLPAAIRLAGDGVVPEGPRHSRHRGRCRPIAMRARLRSKACTAWSPWSRPAATRFESRSAFRDCRRFPRSLRACGACSISPPTRTRIGAHLAEDPILAPLVAGAPGAACPGGVGWIRARDSRGARPADHGRRRRRTSRANWWRATASLWRAPASRRTDSRMSSLGPNGWRRPT